VSGNEPSAEDLARIFEQVKIWGRFGPDDERGALNFVSDAKRAAAAALVREGHAVSCSRELPVEPSSENPRPAQHHMLRAGDAAAMPGGAAFTSTGDYIGVAFHGMATSHLDALCHVLVGGRMYNGFGAGEVKSTGAQRCSVMVARDGIVSRGVLLDVPRARGVRWLEPGERIRRSELDATERAANLRVEEGDVLLISTGRDARRAALGPWDPVGVGLAGLHPECIPWLHERRIAVLGADGVSDPFPASEVPGWPIPVHQCCLVAMGVHLLDNLALAELADACAARRRSEFLFVVAPLRVAGATGSPVNPLAIF
jgi:kynurenine formamidase